MGRPSMPPGSWGKITVTRTPVGTYQAEARYVYFSGRVAKQRARGHSASSARTALVQKLRSLTGAETTRGGLSSTTTIAELATFWLEEKETAGVSINSMKTYRSVVRNQVVPYIGDRSIADCRTSVIDRVIKDRAERCQNVAMLRKVLHGMFRVAVRHDVILSNPVKEAVRINRPRSDIEYLDLDQINKVRNLIDADMQEDRPGPAATSDLRDIVDLILATGCRIGEAGAFVYSEIDLSAVKPTLTVSGTIITETGRGTIRQQRTKSDAGYRTLVLPPFAVDIIMRRMVENSGNRHDAVFPTRRGTWRQISNWERMWNRVVDDTAYDWVTFHTFRRSVATLIDREVGIDAAQAQLGHDSANITRDFYIHKPDLAPDLTGHLERFRPEQ